MTRKLLALSIVLIAAWSLFCFPAAWLAGTGAVRGTALAALVCGLPALATLPLGMRGGAASPAVALVAGMLLRMAFSLGAGVLLYTQAPGLTANNFLLWLPVFYAVALATEVTLQTRSLAKEPSQHGGRTQSV